MSIYRKLCALGPRLIDDSRRKAETVTLDDLVDVFGRMIVVRELIEYLGTTDAFFNEAIEETLSEHLTSGTRRAAVLAAAEVWLDGVKNHLYGLRCKTDGWRVNRKDRKLIGELMAWRDTPDCGV